jgi:hypothetical protein
MEIFLEVQGRKEIYGGGDDIVGGYHGGEAEGVGMG